MSLASDSASSTCLDDSFLEDVVSGLSDPVRTLPSKYFYDSRGSRLFDQICQLEEYYPPRVETEIMVDSVAEMVDRLGPNLRLIEFGSGSSIKTRLLLENLLDLHSYLPVDISGDHLLAVAQELITDYPFLTVSPVVADFTMLRSIEPDDGIGRTCVYFPGSTIGNFMTGEAEDLLASIASLCGTDGSTLIGIDLQKDVDVLEKAYNDRAGVTAEFNKNVLRRINCELSGDFAVDQFDHHAYYDEDNHRMEMHLLCRVDQRVRIDEHSFDFRAGETIRTEVSHKYTIDGFAQIAAAAGWELRDTWTDSQNYFAIVHLQQ